MRPSRRQPDELRAVSLERGVVQYAEGSCVGKFEDTRVAVMESLEGRPPPWLKGWGVTAAHRILGRRHQSGGRRKDLFLRQPLPAPGRGQIQSPAA